MTTKKRAPEQVTRLLIVKAVSKGTRVQISDIFGPSRKQRIHRARVMAVHLLRSVLDLPWNEIAEYFFRTYNSAYTAGTKAETLIKEDTVFRDQLSHVKTLL